MEQHDPNIAPEAATDEPASFQSPIPNPQSPVLSEAEGPIPDFDPIPLRYRTDGLTPQKQREYVEALADTGVAREAAARIGVSEQAVNRARRRADARSFDLACEAAQRFGARRIRSLAFERAVEGTIRRHYYHGELKSEERVYDNRLLIFLLGKVDKWLEPPAAAEAVAVDWEPWMEAIEQGLPAPPEPEPDVEEAVPSEDQEPGEEFDGSEVWQDMDSRWWTGFPPPADFAGIEEGEPGARGYKRNLSEAEQAVIAAEEAEENDEKLAEEIARRDRYFGFAGGSDRPELLSSREAETYEPSAFEDGVEGPSSPSPQLTHEDEP